MLLSPVQFHGQHSIASQSNAWESLHSQASFVARSEAGAQFGTGELCCLCQSQAFDSSCKKAICVH